VAQICGGESRWLSLYADVGDCTLPRERQVAGAMGKGRDPMQARSMAAPARALAAAGVLHLVFGATPSAAQSPHGTEAVRARAEELAEAASRRFDEVLKGESQAQAEHGLPAIHGAPWNQARAWIERSNRDFAGLMHRLAGEVGSKAQAGSVSEWLGQSRERFETIMRQLTRPAEDRSVAAPAKRPEAVPSSPPEAGAPGAREVAVAREPDAGGMGSERPLAERRRAEPAPAAGASIKTPSPAPGREAEKTFPERKPNAEIAAPAGTPPSQRVPRAKTTAPRQQLGEASAVEAGKVRPPERPGEVASPPAPGAAGTALGHKARQQRARRAPRGIGIAAAQAPAVRFQAKSVERAQRETFAKRRSRRAKRAVPPAEASTAKAAASAALHRAARRGPRHRHRREFRACTGGGEGALPGWYVVKAGDTLWGISRHHYGAGRRYRRIATANRRRLHGTTRIHRCERLYLPDAPDR
jgi:nucleoid-associated protein YgaU